MKEKHMWASLRDRLKPFGARCTRIENLVAPGTPDINVCVRGRETWIESKHAARIARSSSLLLGQSHKMTHEQVNWHIAQNRAQGRSFIWVKMEVTHFWIPGDMAAYVNVMTLHDVAKWAMTLDGIVASIIR